MPEKMTKEEAIIAMAIKKARHAKSMLHESTQIMPYDHEVEVVKIKRPKAQNVKIKNQTQKKEGYGMAGETLRDLLRKIEMEIQLTINLAEKRKTLPDVEPLKEIVSEVKKLVDSSFGL